MKNPVTKEELTCNVNLLIKKQGAPYQKANEDVILLTDDFVELSLIGEVRPNYNIPGLHKILYNAKNVIYTGKHGTFIYKSRKYFPNDLVNISF